MTPEERKLQEDQIRNNFSELQQKLTDLKNEVQTESDEAKKQEKEAEIKRLEKELSEIKALINTLSSLQEQDLKSVKTKLESLKTTVKDFRGEVADFKNERFKTPGTYELLKDSETCKRLLNIISSNSEEFTNVPGNTPEAKLEYIFSQIRKGVTTFLKNKLGDSEKSNKVINNTIAPAFEWSLMEMLRDQGNEMNTKMLQGMNEISWEKFHDLIKGVGNFAEKTRGSFNKFSQWINAIDYLSVHNGVLSRSEKSAVLTSPVEFKNYLNNAVFASENFSPYNLIDNNIFKEDENKNFEFGISLQEQQNIISQIGNIEVVNNPKTTALIAKMLDKPEKFFGVSAGLQKEANKLLDGANAINSVTKIVGIDLMGEINKPLEKRGFWYRIIDFICKLIGITGGLEGVVKRWRLDRLKLTDEKNENITKIFKDYQKLAGKGSELSIADANACSSALADFALTDLDKSSTTKGDHLRDVMAKNIDLNQVPVSVIQQTLGNDYIKKEKVTVDGKQQEKVTVDISKITEAKKKELAHVHIGNMKKHLEENYNDLKDFYSNIHNTDDLVICMTASLYADKEDVIEGIKAKVFLPENYGVVNEGTVDNGNTNGNESGSNNQNENYNKALSDLTPEEKADMEKLVDQSKTANTINYLENSTYKKYLNIIERDLNLPRYTLECVCRKESGGKLYSKDHIIGSQAGAQGLFQFMPSTADKYMKDDKLKEKYGKIFSSRTDFLKDPLATAWAAGIMLSKSMNEDNHNLQSALACYNCGSGNYQKRTGGKGNLSASNFGKLKKETRDYVEKITNNIIQHNSGSSTSDFLAVNLGDYSWNNSGSDNENKA